ncbi:MAG: hypothetical protein KDA21_07325 [Phycisphaerales bacterium]|nr:hypothetical protein [Phycisphaerales bacterium]
MTTGPDHRTDDDLMEPPAPEEAPENAATERQFPCAQCGARVTFAPGQEVLHCPYCGHDTPLDLDLPEVEELDYQAALLDLESQEIVDEHTIVKCASCAAELDRPPDADAFDCPYCGHSIVATATSRKLIRPRGLLPFRVTRREAREAFRTWVRSLWFAPSALKRQASIDARLTGIFIPYWTYDTATTTAYVGRRGEHYYVTVSYTTVENGKTVQRTRQEQRTRWYPASGVVSRDFDDVLVLASRSLPDTYIHALEPWDTDNLVGYADEYLAGFQAESYQINLVDGFDLAKGLMAPQIDQDIRRDIGGDEQQIISKQSEYADITFKHILLPVWISAYRYNRRVYRFLVNARTGEVRGERPWSFWKITSAVVAVIVIVGVIAAVVAIANR